MMEQYYFPGQALQNLGTALITLGAGWIVDTWGYTHLELFLSGWLLVSLVTGLGAWGLDTSCDTLGAGDTSQAPHKQGPANTYGSVETEEAGATLSLRGL